MDNDQDAAIDNQGAHYHHVGKVQNIAVNTNAQSVVHDGGKLYYPSKKDTDLEERISKVLVDLLGEKNTVKARLVSLILGMAMAGSAALQEPEGLYARVPLKPVLYAGVILLVLGILVSLALRARKNARCKTCGTLYSMKETGKPMGREVTLSDRVERQITRYYSCEKCGANDERVEDDPVAG